MTSSITATLVGGPTLRLTYAGLTFLTDPTFDDPRRVPAGSAGGVTLTKLVGPAIAVDDLGPVDVVLLSHDQHADNLDDAGRALLADVPIVVSTPDAATRLPGVVGLEPWESVDGGRRDDHGGARRVTGRRVPSRSAASSRASSCRPRAARRSTCRATTPRSTWSRPSPGASR